MEWLVFLPMRRVGFLSCFPLSKWALVALSRSYTPSSPTHPSTAQCVFFLGGGNWVNLPTAISIHLARQPYMFPVQPWRGRTGWWLAMVHQPRCKAVIQYRVDILLADADFPFWKHLNFTLEVNKNTRGTTGLTVINTITSLILLHLAVDC